MILILVGAVMPSVKIVRDLSLKNALVSRLRDIEKQNIEWGFFEGNVYTDEGREGVPVAALAYWNHEGANNPARPFFQDHLQRVFNKQKRQIMKPEVRVAFQGIVRELFNAGKNRNFNMKQSQSANVAGNLLQKNLKRSIEYWFIEGSDNRQNSKSWAAKKGHDRPLEYTGKMIDSVEYKIHGG